MNADMRKTREVMRRWAALGVQETRRHRKKITQLEAKSAVYQSQTDQNLTEITDKLNGLIGYVDGLEKAGRRVATVATIATQCSTSFS